MNKSDKTYGYEKGSFLQSIQLNGSAHLSIKGLLVLITNAVYKPQQLKYMLFSEEKI